MHLGMLVNDEFAIRNYGITYAIILSRYKQLVRGDVENINVKLTNNNTTTKNTALDQLVCVRHVNKLVYFAKAASPAWLRIKPSSEQKIY